MVRKIQVVCLSILMLFVLLPIQTVFAAPDIQVDVHTGYEGKVKYGKSVPVTIILTNNGTAFSGDLVIDVQTSYQSGIGESFPVDIGPGETKSISFIVANLDDFYSYGGMTTKNIHLYEGGWKKGKEIDFKGKKMLTGAMYHDDTVFAYALTSNIDRLQALKNVQGQQYSDVQLFSDKQKNSVHPSDDVRGWHAIDVVVVDDYALADLSEKQQQALLAWVEEGNRLIISSTPNVESEIGVFSNSLPLRLESQTTISAEALNTTIRDEDFTAAIPAYKATIQKGSSPLYVVDSQPIAAYTQLGNGIIIQTAFSLGTDAFSSAKGAPKLWGKLLDDTGLLQAGQNYSHFENEFEALHSTVVDTNEFFESFKVSIPFVIGIIIVYIILIIPIVYIVLKRRDKREHAWWIIPVVAIFTSIFIFIAGAKDRIGQSQLQHMAFLDIQQDSSVKAYFTDTILANRAGDYTIDLPKEATVSTLNYFLAVGSKQMHERAIYEQDAVDAKVHLRNVGYWNLASIFGKTSMPSIGNFDIQLTVTDRSLTGSITNSFDFPVKDVAIWTGTQKLKVGSLGPGESVDVNQTLKTSLLVPKRSSNSGYYPSMAMGMDLASMRTEQLSNLAELLSTNWDDPAVIGFVDTKIVPTELEGENAKTLSTSLISQSFKPEMSYTGSIEIPSEILNLAIQTDSGEHYPSNMHRERSPFYFGDPYYVLDWSVPESIDELNVQWESLNLSKMQTKSYEVALWNYTTEQFDELEPEKTFSTTNLTDYMTADGNIKMKLTTISQRDFVEANFPELMLKGEVKP